MGTLTTTDGMRERSTGKQKFLMSKPQEGSARLGLASIEENEPVGQLDRFDGKAFFNSGEDMVGAFRVEHAGDRQRAQRWITKYDPA